MSRLKFIFVCLIFAFTAPIAMGQSLEELQKRRQKAEENIKIISGLITETQASTKKELEEVRLLNAEIKERKVIINSLNAELNVINRQLSQLRSEMAAKQNEIDLLKEEYAKLIYHQYYAKNDYDVLMFVLSANNLAESYRRYRYMKQYSEYCELKVQEIEEAQADLNRKMAEVEQKRAERTGVLNERKQENTKLQKEKNRHDGIVQKNKRDLKKHRADLKKQEAEKNKCDSAIEKMIAKDAGGSKGKDGKTQYALTKEEQLVSGDFEKNQGRLPWPVEKGVVVGSFGLQPHPVWDHVTTNNKGIYIQCPPGSDARAVFEGEVTQCFAIPGSNNAVIIKHGLYRTVYANLSRVTVKVGDKVKAKQSIGKIYSDPENNNKTELYFQVWKDRSIHNPENWLAK